MASRSNKSGAKRRPTLKKVSSPDSRATEEVNKGANAYGAKTKPRVKNAPPAKTKPGYTPKGKPGQVTSEQGKYGNKDSVADILKRRKKAKGKS